MKSIKKYAVPVAMSLSVTLGVAASIGIPNVVVKPLVSSAAPSFSDVTSGWYKDVVLRAADRKVVNGYPDGTFKPNNTVTEAEFL